jgi:hypothetical protein
MIYSMAQRALPLTVASKTRRTCSSSRYSSTLTSRPRHVRRLVADFNSPMPAIDVAHQHLLTARALHTAQKLEGKQEFEVLDWTAIVAGCRVGAGLDGLDSAKVSSAHMDLNIQLSIGLFNPECVHCTTRLGRCHGLVTAKAI